MHTQINSFTVYGLEAMRVRVEVSINTGLPKFEVIGMADAAIKESKERIYQSIQSLGYEIPPGNITVNLAPAHIRKKGTMYDLPIALGILIGSRQIEIVVDLEKTMISGELSLNGEVRECESVFNGALLAEGTAIEHFIFPSDNLSHVRYFDKKGKRGVSTLKEAIDALKGIGEPREMTPKPRKVVENREDFSEVYGNEIAKRAIQLSMIGKLNVLLIGPPGCGKTMLLKRAKGLLSPLKEEEAIEVTKIHSVNGSIPDEGIVRTPPFREVHNTISDVSLIGGGKVPTPGEISLAHRGILFMDEFSEYGANVIQRLRTPMEEKKVHISRIGYNYDFPSDFMLYAAMNPCRCGYYGDHYKLCSCSSEQIKKFYQKISGPILDRIDIILYINPPKKEDLFKQSDITTARMLEEMQGGVEFMKEHPDCLSPSNVRKTLEKHAFIQEIVEKAYEKGFISLRRIKSIVKTAMTVAIFEKKKISENHVYFAMQLCKHKWDFK